ncbi:MAG: hypothetical protein QW153_01110 [Candidatus Bilamarchaeaceae archaeon]
MENANPEELKAKIAELEKKKEGLIAQITKINKRVRYKEYEKKALEPFLEQTKNINTEPIKRKKRMLEFKIATQAYTPKIERELIKEVKKIDKEFEKIKEIDRARRKIKYIEKDIEDAKKEIETIEKDLKKIREELKGLYEKMKVFKAAEKKKAAAAAKKEEELVSLGDMALFEE